MPVMLHDALATYAGRVAATDDPREHRNAARQLQRDLRRLKDAAKARESNATGREVLCGPTIAKKL